MAHRNSEHAYLHFPTQRPNEHVILLLRRHWTVVLSYVAQVFFFTLVLPAALIGVLAFTTFEFIPGSIPYIVLVEAIGLYYLFVLLIYFHHFVDYHLDIWVVTDQRIVSIEQVGLFNRVISELNILRVQDVTSEVKGKIQTFLDFGQAYIQTAGQQERFVFEQVPHPSEVAKIILQVHDRMIKVQNLEQVRDSEAYLETMQKEEGVGTRPDSKKVIHRVQEAKRNMRGKDVPGDDI